MREIRLTAGLGLRYDRTDDAKRRLIKRTANAITKLLDVVFNGPRSSGRIELAGRSIYDQRRIAYE